MKHSATIWLLALCFSGGCSGFNLLNATIPSNGYFRTRDVQYGSLARQKLDVYVPKHPSAKPDIVVFFYGGSWQEGERNNYRFVAQALTSRGFIAVLPDYRVYPSVTFPAFVEDGAAAFAWAHQHAAELGGDEQHVYLMGHSAGAHIAALLTLDPTYLKAVGLSRDAIRGTAALSGPYDFTPRPSDRGPFGMTADQQSLDPAAEPITFADGTAPPMLLVHGLDDQTVEPGNAARLAQRIRESGGSVKTIYYRKKGHVPVVLSFAWLFRGLAPTLADVTQYFHDLDAPR